MESNVILISLIMLTSGCFSCLELRNSLRVCAPHIFYLSKNPITLYVFGNLFHFIPWELWSNAHIHGVLHIQFIFFEYTRDHRGIFSKWCSNTLKFCKTFLSFSLKHQKRLYLLSAKIFKIFLFYFNTKVVKETSALEAVPGKIFGHNRSEILVFLSRSGYILWSSSFSSLDRGIFQRFL